MNPAEPAAAQSIATNNVPDVTAWADARAQFEAASRYWLATVRPDGQPHVMPLFGVWLDGTFYFTSGPGARKAKNLAGNPRCVITAGGDSLDLIVEGQAVKVRDDATLLRVAEVYASKYGWKLTVRDSAYLADFGAPSAGPPPYELYQVRPVKALGLGTEEPYGATRWRFQHAGAPPAR